MGQKLAPFGGGEAGSPSNSMSLGLKPTSVPSGILIHPAIWPHQIWAEYWDRYGRKLCGPSPFGVGGAATPSNTMSLGLRPTSLPSFISIYPAIWSQQIRAENWWGSVPLLGEAELSPRVTQCGWGQGLPACQVSSWSIQPFGHSTPTSQTDRQRSDSIGRTVLQTVAQKAIPLSKFWNCIFDIVCDACPQRWL